MVVVMGRDEVLLWMKRWWCGVGITLWSSSCVSEAGFVQHRRSGGADRVGRLKFVIQCNEPAVVVLAGLWW